MENQNVSQELPAAPNPDHYADLATWRDSVAEWLGNMELAAGSACCSEEMAVWHE